MKKLTATVLLTLLFLTIRLPSLQSFFPDSDGYIDRNILCRWIAAGKGDRVVLDAVANGEPICHGAISVRPHFQYGKNCVSRCEPFTIADQIVEGAKETVVAVKERVRLIFAVRP